MFKILHEDGGARVGKLYTAHGAIDTPAFMPVATKGSVKTLSSEELAETHTQALIANSFLLYLKPGVEVITNAGSLHEFMSWRRAIFTDSGGYQMLRKDFLLGVSKKGVKFRSPFDGSKHLLTPEKCMEIQEALGSDVAMVLDDCPSYGSDHEYVQDSLKRTLDWAVRCKGSRTYSASEKQMLFAIIQGGVFNDLRKESAEKLAELDFDGYGIGGLSIGESEEVMFETLKNMMPSIPTEKPRYLMGVGSPAELLESISLGIDVFDSAFPTRNARHNAVYTKSGKYSIAKGRFVHDFSPLEEGCKCYACKNYSRAYINHLLRVYEALGMRLMTMHNLHFLQNLMKEARKAIASGEFEEFKNSFRG
ncbi:MAG: tRNA guanosine(34) transglycosylase Tgt [Methanobacteriota archaeon]